MIGIKHNKFISNPPQTKSQLEEDIDTKVLKIRLVKNK
jgi:hypothetical protein